MQELTYICDTGDTSEEDGDIEEHDNFPAGAQAKWTFFVNLFTESQINVKLGDCVYYTTSSNSSTDLGIIRVQFIVKDKNHKAWVSGYRIVLPGEVINKNGKRKLKPVSDELGGKIFGNRLAVIGRDIFIPLSAVTGICCGLGVCDIEFGRPRFMDKQDVFSIGNTWDEASGQIGPLNPDYKPCKASHSWEMFKDEEYTPVEVVFDGSSVQLALNSSLKEPVTPVTDRSLKRVSWSANALVSIKLFESESTPKRRKMKH